MAPRVVNTRVTMNDHVKDLPSKTRIVIPHSSPTPRCSFEILDMEQLVADDISRKNSNRDYGPCFHGELHARIEFSWTRDLSQAISSSVSLSRRAQDYDGQDLDVEINRPDSMPKAPIVPISPGPNEGGVTAEAGLNDIEAIATARASALTISQKGFDHSANDHFEHKSTIQYFVIPLILIAVFLTFYIERRMKKTIENLSMEIAKDKRVGKEMESRKIC